MLFGVIALLMQTGLQTRVIQIMSNSVDINRSIAHKQNAL